MPGLSWFAKQLTELKYVIQSGPHEIPALGLFGWINYRACLLINGSINSNRVKSGKPFQLRSKHSRFPLACRPLSSDIKVFQQIFVEREYACLDNEFDGGLIIDCGANVGYASAYFLNSFPNSTVIAVEPDARNFQMAKQNLGPYGDRARVIEAGIWSESCGLRFDENPKFGDGTEWAVQVRKCVDGESAEIDAVDIGTLIADSGFDRVALLKIDIEGSEVEVFSRNFKHWIDRVDNLVIELHTDECRKVFFDAIKDQQFELSTSGELTVCKRRKK